MDAQPVTPSSRPMVEWGLDRAAAELAVLAVHGRFQSPAFMHETAERFDAAPVRFFAPEAAGNTWYPNSYRDPTDRNRPELDESVRVIEASLDQLADAGFGPDRVVLWGFSQGACLLTHYVLGWPGRFAGLVLFTGGYLGERLPPPLPGEPFLGVPVVVRSVEQDPWVSPTRVRETATLLSAAGAAVDLRIDPGDEHIITDEACAAASRLLASGAR